LAPIDLYDGKVEKEKPILFTGVQYFLVVSWRGKVGLNKARGEKWRIFFRKIPTTLKNLEKKEAGRMQPSWAQEKEALNGVRPLGPVLDGEQLA